MIEVIFRTISNKTDAAIVLTQLIYQQNAPAIEQEIATIPAHKTVTVNKTIPFNMVDTEHAIGSLPVVIKKEKDHNIQFRFNLAWGQNLSIDQLVQNLNTENWKDFPTIIIDKATADTSLVTLDITVEGDELEKTKIDVVEAVSHKKKY